MESPEFIPCSAVLVAAETGRTRILKASREME